MIKECNQTFESFANLSDYQIEQVLLKKPATQDSKDSAYDLSPQQAYMYIWHELRSKSKEWVIERWNRLHPETPWQEQEDVVDDLADHLEEE